MPGRADLSVICARPDGQDEAVGAPVSPVLAAAAGFTDRIFFAGRFPNADVDPWLTERVVVIGEVSALAAVVLRLLRRGRLGSPETGPPDQPLSLGYVPLQGNNFQQRWNLAVGTAGVAAACTGTARPIPFLRNDNGGVLVDEGVIDSPTATVYVDETLALRGTADRLVVRPGGESGLELTLERRRALRLPPRREQHRGRAASLGFAAPTIVVSDGIPAPRPLPRWTWYAHTEPLPLVRP